MKSLCLIKKGLFLYKKNLVLRIGIVFVSSSLVWIFIDGGLREAMATLILVWLFEYMTINIIFYREFYPLDIFADKIFPDRNAFGYNALYIGFYVYFWLTVIYYLL